MTYFTPFSGPGTIVMQDAFGQRSLGRVLDVGRPQNPDRAGILATGITGSESENFSRAEVKRGQGAGCDGCVARCFGDGLRLRFRLRLRLRLRLRVWVRVGLSAGGWLAGLCTGGCPGVVVGCD